MSAPRWFSGRTLAVVVAGGTVGVGLRALLIVPVDPAGPRILVPALTLAINVLGSFLLGVLVARLGESRPLWRAFCGTGVISGFTTYSAFAVQVISVGGASPWIGVVLVLLSLFGGALAAALGLSLGQRGVTGDGQEPV